MPLTTAFVDRYWPVSYDVADILDIGLGGEKHEFGRPAPQELFHLPLKKWLACNLNAALLARSTEPGSSTPAEHDYQHVDLLHVELPKGTLTGTDRRLSHENLLPAFLPPRKGSESLLRGAFSVMTSTGSLIRYQ